MDSIDAFISDLLIYNTGKEELITSITDNFGKTEEEARELYAEWLSNAQVEQDIYQRKRLKIKNNPGFPIIIKKIPFENKIHIRVENINNIAYIPSIRIYLDTMIRLHKILNLPK